jgi:hypothetical protein
MVWYIKYLKFDIKHCEITIAKLNIFILVLCFRTQYHKRVCGTEITNLKKSKESKTKASTNEHIFLVFCKREVLKGFNNYDYLIF